MTSRFPRIALLVLVVGLAVHNLAMALLWQAGVRDTALDVVAAWKDVLLLCAVVLALAAAGSIPALGWPDRLALAYGAIVVVYWLLPQSWLGGDATGRGELYALRHHLLPLGAYVLGRLIVLDRAWWRRVAVALVAVGVGLAAWGLVDVYLVPLQWWRDSGVPDDQVMVVPDTAAGTATVQAGRADAFALTSLSIRRLAENAEGVEMAEPFGEVGGAVEDAEGFLAGFELAVEDFHGDAVALADDDGV